MSRETSARLVETSKNLACRLRKVTEILQPLPEDIEWTMDELEALGALQDAADRLSQTLRKFFQGFGGR
jgi:hypothetical protein